MKLGIVGAEQAKFTPETEADARRLIRSLIAQYGATLVVSGQCHLGGVDRYAVEEAFALNIPYKEFPALQREWSKGFKPRNMQIAELSDAVVSIVVRTLPPTYRGMRFPLCYHCGVTTHVKSGGCWTAKYARTLGKTGSVIIVG